MPYLVHYRDQGKCHHTAVFIDLETAQACAERVHGVVTDGMGERVIDARHAGRPTTLRGCAACIPGILLWGTILWLAATLFVRVLG